MKKALILIDIQNDYFKNGKMPLEGSEEASLNAKKILEKFRAESLPIIHIQHHSIRSDATFFIPNTNGVQIHQNVKPLQDEIIITKHYPNSFRDTKLLQTLQSLHINELIFCGMMTHMCVDATVRASKDFGYKCTLISDGCATKELEIEEIKIKASEVQGSFLAALSYFYAKVLSAEKYLCLNLK